MADTGVSETAPKTDWHKYYEVGASSFNERKQAYKTAINNLKSQLPDFLSDSPKTFLLGGFVPSNGTPEAFDNLCRSLHDNPDDQYIYLDINAQPFSTNGDKLGVQADLAKLPFREDSLDVVFLDGTADLMDDQALQGFAEGASKVLTRNGIILVTKLPKGMAEHQIKNIPVLQSSIKLYPREDEDLGNLLGVGLKPAYHYAGRFDVDQGYDMAVVAFSRADSDFNQIDLKIQPTQTSRISFKTSS